MALPFDGPGAKGHKPDQYFSQSSKKTGDVRGSSYNIM